MGVRDVFLTPIRRIRREFPKVRYLAKPPCRHCRAVCAGKLARRPSGTCRRADYITMGTPYFVLRRGEGAVTNGVRALSTFTTA